MMRNITPSEIGLIYKETGNDLATRVIPCLSFINSTEINACSVFIFIDNLTMPVDVIPWSKNAETIISNYTRYKSSFSTYHITCMGDLLRDGSFEDMFDRICSLLKQGDILWVNIRTETDLYNISSFDCFTRLSSEIYCYQLDTQFLQQRIIPK